MKKNIKRVVSILLSLVLVFGGIPSFTAVVNADECDKEIWCSPLTKFSKVGDFEFCGEGADGLGFEVVDNIKWYKVTGADTYTPMSDTEILQSGEDYLVSMTWHERTYSMESNGKFKLINFYNEDEYDVANYDNENDIFEQALNDKHGYYKDSTENAKDKQVVFYVGGTAGNMDVITNSQTAKNVALKLFVSSVSSPTPEDLTPISWYEVYQEGFDLSKLYIGTNDEDAANNGATFVNIDEAGVTTLEKGKPIHFSFSYKDSWITDIANVKNVSINGQNLFRQSDTDPLNTFSEITSYYWDDSSKRFTFIVEDVLYSDIDSVEFLNPYLGETYLHFKTNDDAVTYDLDCDFMCKLYEGTFDKTAPSTDSFRFNSSLIDVGYVEWTMSPYSIDTKENIFDFYVFQYGATMLEYKDYTIVLTELYSDTRVANDYYINFHPILKSNYEIAVRDMKKGTSVNDWLNNIEDGGLICQTLETNTHWLQFKLLCFDEYYDIEPGTMFDDKTKYNFTFSYLTTTLPESVELVKANSDYLQVTLSKNTNMNFYEAEEFFDLEGEEIANAINEYKEFENAYNYKEVTDFGAPVPVYEVICRVTLDFSPVQTSHTTKKYTVKNVNTSAEKIKGSGSKGSTRTVVPKEGKKVSSVVVTDSKGNVIPVTLNEDGTYSFTQPAGSVNVEVVYKNREIKLTIGSTDAFVDEELNSLDVCPVIRNDRTMLPIRFVAENLGAKVEWDEKNPNIVTITRGDTEIVIHLGSDKAYVNGKEFTLDSVAFAENDRTYLPVRFVSEKLNAIVEWNEAKPMEVKIYER